MILADYHVHSDFSTDSHTPMEDMVEAAQKLGFHSLCFTDHMDIDFPEKYTVLNSTPPYFVFEPNAYMDKLNHLIQDNPYGVQILKGVELGLRPELIGKQNELLGRHPWDFVIGSVHLVGDLDPYREDYWNGIEEHAGIVRFFEGTLNCVTLDMDFDVLGHLDYIFRYAPSKNRLYSYSKYADLLDGILKALIEQGKGIEVNTSGLKMGLGVTNPHPDIVKRYKELGGEILTIGSDAHVTEYLGYRFLEVSEWLQSIGFRHYTLYKNRKPTFERL